MLLLIDAVPDFIEILVLVILSLAAGLSSGFFIFRIKNKRDLGIFEARETALANREKELVRIRAALKAERPDTKENETLAATVDMLREEIEQTELDISIMKEDHGLEIKLLMDEIASLKAAPGSDARFSYEIEDVSFTTHQPDVSLDEESHSGDGSAGQESDLSLEEESPDAEDLHNEIEEAGETQDESAEAISEATGEATEEATREETGEATGEATITGWASTIVANVIDGVISSFSGSEEEVSEEIPEHESNSEAKSESESDLSPRPNVETSNVSIPAFPIYESLSELFDLEFLRTDPEPESENILEEIPDAIQAAGLQALVNLSDQDFKTLRKMGFDSYDRIALLSSPEISELASTFDVPTSTIEKIWISGAQLRLYEGAV